jgi:hypothetical protein
LFGCTGNTTIEEGKGLPAGSDSNQPEESSLAVQLGS